MPSLGKFLKNKIAEIGAAQTYALFTEGLESGDINRETDVSLRDLAEGLIGPNWDYVLRRNSAVRLVPGQQDREIGVFPEAGDAVDSSMFADITGQILFQEIKQQYEAAEFIGDQLCRTLPITNKNLGEEKIPYLSGAVDAPPHVQEGMPYPATEFQQQYVILPPPVKFGEICKVTMEMIFSDHTMQARESAASVGERVRVMKEERILQTVLGLRTSYKFNSSTAAATYQASTPYINTVGSTPFTDAESVNVAEQMLAEMTNPVTGKPIMVRPNALLCMPRKRRYIRTVLGANEIRRGDGASTSIATYSPDYLDNEYPILSTRYGYNLLTTSTTATGNNLAGGGLTATQAKEYWLLGDFKKAFVWRQALPLQTFLAPPLAPDDFERDIVLQVKAREYGDIGVYDPRYVVLLYST